MGNLLVQGADLLRAVPGLQPLAWRLRSALHALERRLLVGRPVLPGAPALSRALAEGRPFCAGKLGATEAEAVVVFMRRQRARQAGRPVPGYPGHVLHKLFVNAGVFPQDEAVFDAFCEIYIKAAAACDFLAAWDVAGEARIIRAFCPGATLVQLRSLEPYFSPEPWSRALAGRRVLAVSPFAASIQKQFARRAEIWPGRDVLPEFELSVLRAPLSAGLAPPESPDWLTALEGLKRGMDESPCDVALIGAGAFSLPLAAHAKATGKAGLHLGGALQILFGILGQRWREHRDFKPFVNASWTSPSPEETPQAFRKVEGGCYW